MWKYGIVIVAVAGLFSGSAYADCVPVKGKIVNNIFPITQTSFFTMGVATVVFDTDIKLKCAILGTLVQLPPNVAFVHTISCDDAISDPPIHSRLQFNTVGTQNADFSFTETATPIPGTGTGLFQGVNALGSLTITGQIYSTGAIDMKFSGEACR